ncbi:MAG: hypothetical protein AVDCRST_MAG42-1283, partial [uncultured Chthoniobacterales bacterium]
APLPHHHGSPRRRRAAQRAARTGRPGDAMGAEHFGGGCAPPGPRDHRLAQVPLDWRAHPLSRAHTWRGRDRGRARRCACRRLHQHERESTRQRRRPFRDLVSRQPL